MKKLRMSIVLHPWKFPDVEGLTPKQRVMSCTTNHRIRLQIQAMKNVGEHVIVQVDHERMERWRRQEEWYESSLQRT